MLRKVVWLAFVAMVLLAIFRAIPHDGPGLYAWAREYVPVVMDFVGTITDAINEGLNAPDDSVPDPEASPDSPDSGTEPEPDPEQAAPKDSKAP